MIRSQRDGELVLVEQREHARVAGLLAGAVRGVEEMERARAEGLVAAVAGHDEGWAEWDAWPGVNGEGWPTDVFEMRAEEVAEIWRKSADANSAAGAYAELLVSVHGMVLAGAAMRRMREDRAAMFALNRFMQNEIERQEKLRAKLGMRTDLELTWGMNAKAEEEAEKELLADYAVLNGMDRISLEVCGAQIPAGAGKAVEMVAGDGGETVILPWLFGAGLVEVSYVARRIPARRYESAEELREVMKGARREMISRRLVPKAGA